ncbi:ral guanine nucleotide dissociation stimulator-like [Myotis lucifugus]|uniref:ral guanine nucleotide dissociation stimulator-like n=1 Tax=Myotis lucifugus TaxID=59463 RepID=UPI000CCC3D02|nr:ral guanine nucleotide dissociation stimulator-like [Myotis lucifugus]
MVSSHLGSWLHPGFLRGSGKDCADGTMCSHGDGTGERSSPQEVRQEVRQEPTDGVLNAIPQQEAQGPHAAKRVPLGLKGQTASTGSTNKLCMVQTARAHRLDKLVEHLVPAFLGRDPTFVPTFLRNYRTFATTRQVLDLLLTRYGCIFPYAEEDGGPVDQQKKAIISILGLWLDQCPQDFFQPPDFPGLVMLLAYLELNFPGSDLERQAQLLLSELERREPAEAEEPAPEPDKKRPQEATPTPVASPEAERAPGTAFTDLHEAEEPPAACGQLASAPARPVVPGPGPQRV